MTEKNIVIVGAGFSGLMIAAQQAEMYADLYARDATLPPLRISLLEQGAAPGGLAYGTEEDVYLLNQPAGEMSPFADRPAHFQEWSGAGAAEFASRKQYGLYLRETFAQAFARAAAKGAPVSYEVLYGRTAESIDLPARGAPSVTTDGGDVLRADSVVLATGHARAAFLRKLEGHARYFTYPYKIADVAAALSGDVAIIGTGQSMLDALAVLDAAQYQGTVHAISPHLAEPWAYHPELHAEGRRPYAARILTPEAAEQGRCSGPQLVDALYREIESAKAEGYDVDHALVSIDMAGISRACPEGFECLHAAWKALYGNPTPPERYALFSRFKESGQLKLVAGRVLEGDVAAHDGGFTLQVAGQALAVSALFNCAAFSRDPAASPLVRQADGQGALRRAFNGAVEAGRQNRPDIFVAGPAVSPDKWGVGSFRKNNTEIAALSLKHALGINTTQP